MPTETATKPRREKLPLNGVDTPTLFGTLDVVKSQPELARFPIEFLPHALASCITGGIANIAAARGVALREVESTIEGDINLLGIFGMSKDVRNGYQGIRASFSIKGDAPPEKLQEIVEQSRARSAVFDVLTNGVPVSISVYAG